MKKDCGIVILAAGGSSRLGSPKQLLLWRGRTLIEHAVEEATAAKLYPVVVVTGANDENVSAALQDKDVTVVRNADWQQGMASGIVTGLRAALALCGDLDAVIIAVCDQPFVSAALFQTLVQQRSIIGKGIVTCRYAGTVGTPVLFAATYFDALLSLQGADGAKGLLRMHDEDVASIPFAQGEVDIDTDADYRNLQKMDEHT